MLMAQNQQQGYVNSLDYSRSQLKRLRQQPFYCPVCHAQVMLKIGSTIQPHFAHYSGTECTIAAEGETAEHLAGKALLGRLCRRWRVTFAYEVYLPSIQQRPDLLISIGIRRIALEFQCSPISIDRLQERTQGYRQIGYQVIWILGQRYQHARWTEKNHAFLQYSPDWGWYQWQLRVDASQLWLIHHVVHTGYPQQVSYQRCPVTRIKQIKTPIRQRQSVAAILKESQSLYSKLGQAAPDLLQIQQACYLAGHHLAGAPRCCHRAAMPPINHSAIILLQVRLLLLCEQSGKLTDSQLQQFCYEQVADFYRLPLVDQQLWYVHWCRLVLAGWVQKGIVRRNCSGWDYLGACWYSDFFAKQAAIQNKK
ncbi:competence protein CoiA [Loigolactobacillus zhaoyuanensis]|uniref:Competence protein CoiA n=1 Tax=Loigolactobacillus zhaoyuanensis TaxID=2486017 RepID=A0ABW8UBH8_9LACO